MKRIINFIFLIVLLVFYKPAVFAGAPPSPEIPIGPNQVFIQGTAINELKIMSYNVLNLFDADKDSAKDDWLWLPINAPGKQNYCQNISSSKDRQYCSQFDWTYEKVNWKLQQIKKVVDFQGSKPDMIAVVEVENENVLSLLAATLGYQHYIITNSPDLRGIDVGLMFNTKPGLSYSNWEAIRVPFKSGRPGRDLLRVDFVWNGKPLSVYVNHWPSQRNPIDERISCAEYLAHNIDVMSQANGPTWSAIAVGDFNTLDSEQPNAFYDIMHNSHWSNSLYDAELYARESRQNPALPYTPPGTYYYIKDDAWNRLDRVIVTKNLIDQKDMEFAQESFRILFPQFMSFNFKRYENGPPQNKGKNIKDSASNGSNGFRYVRIPNRYNFDTIDESRRGFSDHLPIVFKLRFQ